MPAPEPCGDPPARTASERLSGAVRGMVRSWIRLTREEARASGLSLPQMFVLGGLYESEAIPVTRWAEIVGASPSATTGLLDGLEADGYVVRTHDRHDRRQVLISLSPKGRALAGRLSRTFRSHWRTFCRGIPDSDLDATAVTLGRIAERMGPPESLASIPLRARAAAHRRPRAVRGD